MSWIRKERKEEESAHAKIKILKQYCGLQLVLIPLSRLLFSYLILKFLID